MSNKITQLHQQAKINGQVDFDALFSLIHKEVIDAVDSADRGHCTTTYDLDLHSGSVSNIKRAINERFGYEYL